MTISPQVCFKREARRQRRLSLLGLLFCLGTLICLGTLSACAGRGGAAKWPPEAKQWFDRGAHSYARGDLEDARLASDNALAALPSEPEVKMLGARVAMAELEFDRALGLLAELPGPEAAGLRGRAHWYLGHIDQAAEELAVMTAHPEVKDDWAKAALKLARKGRGRTPFEMSGGLVAVVEMPAAGTAMLVPLELNGELALAMVATDRAESVIDSKTAREGDWVSLRFGGRIEVSDVPVVAEDLSGLSREMGAPIKLLIGVHLLRKMRVTIDVSGRQFVVRNYEPPPPPEATTITPIFYRGGAMVLPGYFGVEKTAPLSTLLVNTSMAFPLALDEEGWKKGGRDAKSFAAVPGSTKLRHGTLPMLRLGAFEIPNVPGVYGAPVSAVEKEVGVSLDGFAGSGLFATFRITFANEGRTLWMEDLPPYVIEMRREAAAEFRRAREEKAKQALELTAPSPSLTAPSPLVGGDPPPSPSEKAAP